MASTNIVQAIRNVVNPIVTVKQNMAFSLYASMAATVSLFCR